MRKATELPPSEKPDNRTGARNGCEYLGKKLTGLRTRHRLNQMQVAEETGISRTMLASIEKGLHMPTVRNLAILAAFYDVTLDDLAGHLKP